MTSSVVFPKTTETVVLWPIWPTEYAGTDWNRLHYLHCRASKVPRLPEVGEAEVACDGLSIGPRQCAVHGLDEHLRSADESIDKQIVDKSPCKSESLQNKLDIPSPSKLSNARICFFFSTLDAVWLSTRGGEIRVRQEAPSANGQPPEPVLQAPKSPAWLSDDSEPGSKKYNVNVNNYLKLLTKHYDMLVIDQAHHGIAYKLDTMHHYAGDRASHPVVYSARAPCLLTHLHVRTTLPKQLALHLFSSSLIHGCAWCNHLST